MQTVINSESDKKISSRAKQASDTKNYIKKNDTPQDILDKLEIAVGPVRLMIIAGANGEICTHHRIGKIEAMRLQDDSYGIRPIQTEVWHKERDYQYIIDRGSGEATSQFDKDQLQQIIEPMIKIYIERLERTYFSSHADHGACIRNHEERENTNIERDYTTFIG
jgi:hypothetical protein